MSAAILKSILSDIGYDCDRCPLSGQGKLVFGSGPPNAKIFLVGEGPGQTEAEKGTPFVGRAGVKLNELLADAGISRGECYVGNIVKHRPPGNRDPKPEEIKACLPFLKKQIHAVRPKIIILLGAVASQVFLDAPISMCLGSEFEWETMKLIATYHPSYVLRQPHARVQVVADFQRAKRMVNGGSK